MGRGNLSCRGAPTPLSAFLALVCITAAADVASAVHLFAEGSSLHEQHGTGVGSTPKWSFAADIASLSEFATVLQKEPLALVYFYAPWSEASVRFYPALDVKVAEPLSKLMPSVPVVGVNVVALPDLGREYRIQTLPTFAAFRHGVIASAAENQFPRHAEGVRDHMLRLLEPAVDEVGTVGALQQLLNATWPHAPIAPPREPSRHPDDRVERTIVVGYLADPDVQKNFISAARFVGGFFRMALVAEKDVATAFGAKLGTIVAYRRWGDGKPVAFPAARGVSMADISRFLVYKAVAPVSPFTEDTRPVLAQRHKPMLVYLSPARLGEAEPLFATLSDMELDEALNVTVVHMNPNTAGKTVAKFLGFDSTALESEIWAIGLLVARRKYRFDVTLPPTAENLRAFVSAAQKGDIAEYHRSEGRSAMRPPGDVSDLTYENFAADIIDDKARDALILVYHPTSRACRDLLEIFDLVAAKLRNVAGVVVGRFNAHDNDYHDAYVTPGYPSILYARRDKKLAPVRFQGVARTPEHLLEFVAEHAAVSLSSLSPSNQTPSAPTTRRQPADPSRSEDL